MADMETLNSKFGINSRVKLEIIGHNSIGIIKRIKSRIIQKDALKIIEIANMIREKNPEMNIRLICNDNICSKSIALLKENELEVYF